MADYTHGQVVEAMVCNRLMHPRGLSSLNDWGERFAVQQALAIAPVKLNDDRLGRALDAVAGQLDEILDLVARRAVERFGLELAELHWDLAHRPGRPHILPLRQLEALLRDEDGLRRPA